MEAIVPEKGAGIDKETIYWDHLAIMSDFELDVDYPEGTITKEAIQHETQKPEYPGHFIKYRYYGHFIEGMIQRVCAMEMGPERAAAENCKLNINPNTIDKPGKLQKPLNSKKAKKK